MTATFVLRDVRRGGLLALAAATLFGLSTPAAKAIIGNVHPLLLAGLLYLGSGLGLAATRLFRKRQGRGLKGRDLPWLGCTILFGGGVGPALLMTGLAGTTGSIASLLLTLEGVFTATLAWIVFRESFNRRIGLGMLLIFAGAVLLALRSPAGHGSLFSSLAIIGACLSWAIDNNCTSRISDVDVLTLASIKGVAAGAVNSLLAILLGGAFPAPPAFAAAWLIGLFGYGLSLVLFVLALREVGAARTGAYFATAPFIGAIVSLLFLREPLTMALGMAGLLMSAGVYLHLTESGGKQSA